jgi:hypothetical protein
VADEPGSQGNGQLGTAAASGPGRAVELAPLEVAIACPLGPMEGTKPIKVPRGPAPGPVEAMEEVLAEALARPPCLVAFSGGRDSSAMLALAARVSRERALPLPVPATELFKGDEATEEEEWQSLVIKDLGLADWCRIHIKPAELDLVGPVAAQVLSRHGLLWPFNTHFQVPVLEQARGGSIVTGVGGDEVGILSEAARAERILARQEHVSPGRAMAVVGLALAPRWLRELVYWRRYHHDLPWLTPRGQRLARRAFAREEAEEPFGFDWALEQLWRSRYLQVSRASYQVVSSSFDVAAFHPFTDPRVLTALAASGGFPGFGTRTALVRSLFGEVLPSRLVTRPTKASFTRQAFSAASAEFAKAWSGGGVPHDLVKADWLRDAWMGPRHDGRTATLLQAAWLHDHPR